MSIYFRKYKHKILRKPNYKNDYKSKMIRYSWYDENLGKCSNRDYSSIYSKLY